MSGLSNLLNKGRYNCSGAQLFTSNPILSPDHHTAMETLYNHLCTRYRNITTPTNHLTSQQPTRITNQPTNQPDKQTFASKKSIYSTSASYLAANSSPRNISILWTSFFFSGMCCLLSPKFSVLNLSSISWIHKFSFLC